VAQLLEYCDTSDKIIAIFSAYPARSIICALSSRRNEMITAQIPQFTSDLILQLGCNRFAAQQIKSEYSVHKKELDLEPTIKFAVTLTVFMENRKQLQEFKQVLTVEKTTLEQAMGEVKHDAIEHEPSVPNSGRQ
jgi:hypothetical protein